MAVPGQWPGPRFSVESVIPSHIEWSSWIFGMAIVPICTAGSSALGLGGACGWGSVGAVVVGKVAGTVVVAAVVGATVVVGTVVGGIVTVTVATALDGVAVVTGAIVTGAPPLSSLLVPQAASPTSASDAASPRQSPCSRME